MKAWDLSDTWYLEPPTPFWRRGIVDQRVETYQHVAVLLPPDEINGEAWYHNTVAKLPPIPEAPVPWELYQAPTDNGNSPWMVLVLGDGRILASTYAEELDECEGDPIELSVSAPIPTDPLFEVSL